MTHITGNPGVDLILWLSTGINGSIFSAILIYSSIVREYRRILTFAAFLLMVYCPLLWVYGVPDQVARLLTPMLWVVALFGELAVSMWRVNQK